MDTKVVAAAEQLLNSLFGERVVTDENFHGTALRIAKAYAEILDGEKDTEKQIETALSKNFPSSYDESISCTGHIAYSMCPHHLLPVKYKVSIVYMPAKNGYVVGASKLARLVDILSHRAVLQETLADDIIHALESYLCPRGIGLLLKGNHSCMQMRGVKTQGDFRVLKFTGCYKDIDRCRNEALFLFNNH